MTVLKSIYVENVRGIESLEVKLDAHPNKPTFVVAPNGCGKTSMATALKSLTGAGMRLMDDDLHNGDPRLEPLVKITFDEPVIDGACSVSANSEYNVIPEALAVEVVNSPLIAKATTSRYQGKTVTQSDVAAPEVIMVRTIPEKVALPFSLATYRKGIPGPLARRVADISEALKSPEGLRAIVDFEPCFTNTGGQRYSKLIEAFLEEAASAISLDGEGAPSTAGIAKVLPLQRMVEQFGAGFGGCEAERYLNAVALNRFCKGRKRTMRARLTYLEYEAHRARIDAILAALDTTGREVRLTKSGKSLVLSLPPVARMSNGERDVLTFAARLIHAVDRLGDRPRALLVIDQVLDYLDDANLAVAQYYLLRLMERSKAEGRELYVLLMTHLDPSLMESYRFRARHVAYFGTPGGGAAKVGGPIGKLIRDRDRCQASQPDIYNEVSDLYLHFSPLGSVASANTERYLKKQGFPGACLSPEGFAGASSAELGKYLSGKPFDAAFVCCAVRVAVEGRLYDRLADDDREGFLDCKRGTEERIAYAETHGVEVPDAFSLLGVIYNEALHLGQNKDQEQTLFRKLGNAAIRQMVADTVGVED